jgi:Tfp pilus assembly protein PilV
MLPPFRFRLRRRLGAGRLRRQAGFTLVETMVAATLLLVGLVGTLKLIDAASTSQSSAKAREGATNLARELLEDAHNTGFSQIGSAGWITPALQNLDPGAPHTVTTPTGASVQTTVARRGVTYTATVSWCSVDDSKDGYGTHSGSITWCSDSSTTGTADSAPEDLKRVTAQIDYSINGNSQTLKQTVTFSATGGMVAPAPPTLNPYNPTLSGGSPYTISNGAQTDEVFRAIAQGAADMKFSVNGVEVTSGVVNQGGGTWDFDWQIAGLLDGTYTIGATAIDALGNRGQPLTIQVRLARGAPLTAQSLVGGYNYVNPTGNGNGGSLVVELDWDANGEGSVTGYEVLRGATSVCGGQTSTATACIDTSPPTTGTTVYTVKTWYRDASNNMQSTSTTYSVTAPPANLGNLWGVVNTQNNLWAGTSCVDSGTIQKMGDLVQNFPTSGGTTATYNGQYFFGCMAKFTGNVTLSAGTVSGQVYFSNTINKNCVGSNLPAFIEWTNANGTVGGIAGGPYNVTATVPANSAVARYTWSGSIVTRSFTAGQQLFWIQNVTHASTNCAGVTVYYNSGTYQTTVTFPGFTGGASGLVTPNTPTGLTVTVNGDGTRTLNWTAPTSSSSIPAPDFYRIYRDGTATSARYDATDAINTTVGTASSAGATTLTVANSNGYAPGQAVLVDTGANQDVMTISSITGNTITFTAGMGHAHAVGVPVVLRAVSWTDTNTGGSSHTYRVTATSVNLAESPYAGPVTG